MERPKGVKSMWFLLFPVLVIAAVVAVLIWRCERELPQIAFEEEIGVFSQTKEIPFRVTDNRSGLRRIEAHIVQGSTRGKLFAIEFPRQGYFGSSGPASHEGKMVVDSKVLGLADGQATFTFSAQDYSWWGFLAGNSAVIEKTVVIDTKPPVIQIVSSPRCINTGGAGVAVYRVGEEVREHGVKINDRFHPGYPLAGGDTGAGGPLFVAYIGLPYDTTALTSAFVTARDAAGNEGRAPFEAILKNKIFKHDRIAITDDFLNKKLPEFRLHYPELTGPVVDQYLYVNGNVRVKNAEKIAEICQKSNPERLWDGVFDRLPRSDPRAGYADHRAYYYGEKMIDEQVHLGIDLASVFTAPVPAANHGIVVFAEYLGIYGNTVIVDHGQGLFSLYSHLSQISVSPGAKLQRGEQLGLTGLTGMAGGDHLHFSMLVNGVFVNPIEWWDDHWLKDNIFYGMPQPGQAGQPAQTGQPAAPAAQPGS